MGARRRLRSTFISSGLPVLTENKNECPSAFCQPTCFQSSSASWGDVAIFLTAHRTTTQWLNPDAFPYQTLALNYGTPDQVGIGRFGNAPVGGVVGPGMANFSLSLMKSVALHEKTRLQLSVEAANVFNHRNYEPPNMQVDSGGFGSITALQTAEGAGPRSLEVAGRISF